MTPAPAAGPLRVESLDILRGLMALAVAFYHFTTFVPVFQPGHFMAYTAAKAGHYGVEGFFIISGFCFFYLYTPDSFRNGGFGKFHLKRFLRIAPLYFAAVVANQLLNIRVGPEATPRMWLLNGTLTFGLFHPNYAMVLGGWSIGLEYVFYLAFPILVWLAARYRPFLGLAALALLALSAKYTLYTVPFAPRLGEQNFHQYVQIGNHAFLFFLGGLVAQARLQSAWRLTPRAFLWLSGGLTAAFCLRYRNFYDHWLVMQGPPRYYFVAISFALVAVFAFWDFPPSPWKRIGVFLGEISYSVYLLHPFVMVALSLWAPKGMPPAIAFLLGLAATLGLSTLTHRWLEKPAMDLAKRLTSRSAKTV